MTLPAGAKADDIKANYDDGIPQSPSASVRDPRGETRQTPSPAVDPAALWLQGTTAEIVATVINVEVMAVR